MSTPLDTAEISPAKESGDSTFSSPSSFENGYAEEHDHRILIVDDEEPVRGLYATYLGETYSCETAADAQEALEILARERFALVLTDMQMPGLGGTELLRRIVERYPDTAVIMISGIDRTQRVIDAMRVGASDYLLKPCDLDVLSVCVERALEHRMLLRNARRYKLELETRNVELAHQKAEMVRLQAQILHAEKMASLGLLAAGVAHELNNPAGFIVGNVQLMQEYIEHLKRYLTACGGAVLPSNGDAEMELMKEQFDCPHIVSELESILADCQLGAERIRDVVQNLRLFSRLDEAEIKRVDLNQGLEATLRLLSTYYKRGNIELQRDYGDLPPVNCYAAQLNQVWMNLLLNAAQAIGNQPGIVRIMTRCKDSIVTVSINDTGPGIIPENLKRIFDPFFTTKPVGEGTGLGLSISHSIIEKHRGSIKVDNLPGEGTTFTITLPVDAEERPSNPNQLRTIEEI